MSRRLGSAIALKVSDVVAARGITQSYSYTGICQAVPFSETPTQNQTEAVTRRTPVAESCLPGWKATVALPSAGGTTPRARHCGERGRASRPRPEACLDLAPAGGA